MVNTPPLSPVNITSTARELAVLQRLEGSYFIDADGALVMVAVVVVSKPGQGDEGAILYFTECIPTVLVAGEIAPVVLSIINPASLLNVPPFVPVIAGDTEGVDEHISG